MGRPRSGVSAAGAIVEAAQVAKADVVMALSRLDDAAPWAGRYPILNDLLYSEDENGELLSLFKLINRAREAINEVILLAQGRGE